MTQSPTTANPAAGRHFYRFHTPHLHLQSVFGDDWFALKAEAFARFFGTPSFLIAQTVIGAVWIVVNAAGLTTFDIYPFILLNLAFSLQAAYAAPLILLAQTRQADRDTAHAIADYSMQIKLKPDVLGYINRCNAYRDSEQLDRAAADYAEVIRLAPEDARVNLRKLGVAL